MAVVTHEMSFARQVADRMVFMDAGRSSRSRAQGNLNEQQHSGPAPF